jgi:hypothetical protein
MADFRIGSQSVQRYTDGSSGRQGPAVDSFPRTSDGIPGACTSPKRQMGPSVGQGLPLCASFRNGGHLSGRGRSPEPYCGPGCGQARPEPQRSKYQAGARAQRFEASRIGSAPSASCAQAASHRACGHDLPVARAVTGQTITDVKPACFRLVSAVAVTLTDLAVAVTLTDLAVAVTLTDLAVANPDLAFTNVMAKQTSYLWSGRRPAGEPTDLCVFSGVPSVMGTQPAAPLWPLAPDDGGGIFCARPRAAVLGKSLRA